MTGQVRHGGRPKQGTCHACMTRYEMMYIIPATIVDDEVGGVETKVAGILTKHGAQVEGTKRLGKFRLTYPIKHERFGNYVLVHFQAERASVGKIEENLRILPEVLRHLVLRADEAGEGRYELVQFQEVNVELKEDRPRRRDKPEGKEGEKEAEIKAGVAALEKPESAKAEEGSPVTSEELDKKIASALSDDTSGV